MAEGGQPLDGHETFDELVSRYFPSPAIYTLPWGRFLLLVLLPGVLPLVSWLMVGPPLLTILLSIAAVVFSGTTLLLRWPPRLTVRIDRRGIAWRRRAVSWRRVAGVTVEPPARGRTEPLGLRIGIDGELPILLPESLTQTAEIRSLRNLAELIEALAVAARTEADAEQQPPS